MCVAHLSVPEIVKKAINLLGRLIEMTKYGALLMTFMMEITLQNLESLSYKQIWMDDAEDGDVSLLAREIR